MSSQGSFRAKAVPVRDSDRWWGRFAIESSFRKGPEGFDWVLELELEDQTRAHVAYLQKEELVAYKPIDC